MQKVALTFHSRRQARAPESQGLEPDDETTPAPPQVNDRWRRPANAAGSDDGAPAEPTRR